MLFITRAGRCAWFEHAEKTAVYSFCLTSDIMSLTLPVALNLWYFSLLMEPRTAFYDSLGFYEEKTRKSGIPYLHSPLPPRLAQDPRWIFCFCFMYEQSLGLQIIRIRWLYSGVMFHVLKGWVISSAETKWYAHGSIHRPIMSCMGVQYSHLHCKWYQCWYHLQLYIVERLKYFCKVVKFATFHDQFCTCL